MFKDEEILETMENRHIKKSKTGPSSSKFKDAVSRKMEAALANFDDAPPLMKNLFSSDEAKATFERNKGAPGPDLTNADMIDCTDRDAGCLSREAVESCMGSG